MTTIWHNPRCSKSRQTLALLEERGIEVKIRRYLEDIPSSDELRSALELLGCVPFELMRTKEKRFRELMLSKSSSEDALISAMVQNPVLIERPIVFHDGRAAIGRPPERILDILQTGT